MNTPLPEGYKIVKTLGLVTGLTARSRGVGGRLIAGIESAFGGEITAYSTEIEKARVEAIDRLKDSAVRLGANAVVGVDIETANVFEAVVILSATGTALVVEKKK